MASTVQLLAWLAAAYVLHQLALAFYRLYFSHIAHIPGLKLAAITIFYEAYWDSRPDQDLVSLREVTTGSYREAYNEAVAEGRREQEEKTKRRTGV
ncbi:hypothetical protein BAUCODRAFT_150107 [Baudoinia panamericana UAMH 10762]|uniref:Uncharacterized protein n=1 Tax=Baudoinia panamericana (strain UAMH 10762) TaxID=717646 RepID=M2MBH8_BAUPA|nr:uncharacterized protein BAUCODRAFT_150107 [Baudoinia panamericana UAMH 10762]EMC93866.1 hypothetical protein BAUCODRAFT_150107 [Baudoinia panamericana UAMH 10762]